MAAWIITEDVIGEGEENGVAGPRNAKDEEIEALKKGAGHAFRMHDDDGELYYRGRCMSQSFSPLDHFGMPNAGCTSIQYKVDGKWQTL